MTMLLKTRGIVACYTARRLTRRQVDHEKRPSLATLWWWLECGVERGLVVREGTGKYDDPHRYTVAGLEVEPWAPDAEDILNGPFLGARVAGVGGADSGRVG